MLGRPEQDFGCWVERKGYLHGPAANTRLTAAQDSVGLFATRTFKRMARQDFQVLPSCTACAGAWGCSLTGIRLCTPFLEQHEFPLSPFLPPVQVLWKAAELSGISFSNSGRVHCVPACRCWTVLVSVLTLACLQLYFVLRIAALWFPASPAIFSPHPCTYPPVCSPSSSAGACQTETPSCAHGPAQAWELSQQDSPCSSLRACTQGHSSYLSCVHCSCVPTSQGSCLASPTLCPCHFWCKALLTWLTSLSTDIFAPCSQIDPVPRVFIFYSGRKKTPVFELTSQSALRCNYRKKVLS